MPDTLPGRLSSEKVYRVGRRWLQSIMARCLETTRSIQTPRRPTRPISEYLCVMAPTPYLACALLIASMATTIVRAQPGDQTLDQPTTQQAYAIYDQLRSLLDTWTIPASDDPTRLPIPAARVAIYQSGRLLGSHTAWALDAQLPDQHADPVDLALAGAMTQAQRALLPRRDALWQEKLSAIAPGLTLSLELAGPMTPLSAEQMKTPDAALRPGIQGMAARLGERWALIFPSRQAALGTRPSIEYPAMAAKLLDDPDAALALLPDLAADRSVVFYRFDSILVVGASANTEPQILTRLSRVIEPREMTVASLVRFATEMLTHLEARRYQSVSQAAQTDDDPQQAADAQRTMGPRLGLRGTLHPLRRGDLPTPALPTAQAIAAYALLDLAQVPQVDASVRTRAHALALAIMLDLQDVRPGEIDAADDGVAMAVVWVVLKELGVSDDPTSPLAPLWTKADAMMQAHLDADPISQTGSVSDALLVWALAKRALWNASQPPTNIGDSDDQPSDNRAHDRERAEHDLRSLFVVTQPGAHVGLMPWLGWAELALTRPDHAIPAAGALGQIRTQVWEHQLSAETAAADRDFVGGVVFTEGFATLPTWNTTRPIAFLGTMLGEPRLTSSSHVPSEVIHLLAAMRFLRQLQADDTVCLFCPEPTLARGGLRAATWDNAMPLEATSMGLISVSEFLQSLAKASSLRATPPHSPNTPTLPTLPTQFLTLPRVLPEHPAPTPDTLLGFMIFKMVKSHFSARQALESSTYDRHQRNPRHTLRE